jgi:hypothetical protein
MNTLVFHLIEFQATEKKKSAYTKCKYQILYVNG